MGALPKTRLSSRRQAKRTRAISLPRVNLVDCQECGKPKPPHSVCPACGKYKGKFVTT